MSLAPQSGKAVPGKVLFFREIVAKVPRVTAHSEHHICPGAGVSRPGGLQLGPLGTSQVLSNCSKSGRDANPWHLVPNHSQWAVALGGKIRPRADPAKGQC